jgi:hypothetical protein
MTWLIAFLVKNAVAISAIGVTAGAIANIEQVVVNTVRVVKVVQADDDKKE